MKDINTSKTDVLSQAYIFLGRAFSFPDSFLQEIVKKGEGQNLAAAITAELPFEVDLGVIPYPSQSWGDMESLYITAFDVGTQGMPPCPLYEGLIRKDEAREGIIMELLRFYHYFDVKLSEKERDFPDHLVTELEFMAYLVQKEVRAIENGREPEPYRLAQLDFLERHLGRWVPLLDERLQNVVKEPFYQRLITILRSFIEAHTVYLKGLSIRKSNGDIEVENYREKQFIDMGGMR